tara:strand:+ start:1090 stop:1350 length:261 start_codon:yes stop_codon:yes gene_type:complete
MNEQTKAPLATDEEMTARFNVLVQQRNSALDQIVMLGGTIARLETDLRNSHERTGMLLKQLNQTPEATHVEGAWAHQATDQAARQQ